MPSSAAADLLSISPFIVLETTYRLDGDGGVVDSNPASATFNNDVINDNVGLGFYQRTQDVDGDGLVDFADGIAVRRHNFIPAYQLNIGTDINLTPIFISRSGSLINNWRFHMSLVASMPVTLKLFAASYDGAPLASAGEIPITWTISFGAAYCF